MGSPTGQRPDMGRKLPNCCLLFCWTDLEVAHRETHRFALHGAGSSGEIHSHPRAPHQGPSKPSVPDLQNLQRRPRLQDETRFVFFLLAPFWFQGRQNWNIAILLQDFPNPNKPKRRAAQISPEPTKKRPSLSEPTGEQLGALVVPRRHLGRAETRTLARATASDDYDGSGPGRTACDPQRFFFFCFFFFFFLILFFPLFFLGIGRHISACLFFPTEHKLRLCKSDLVNLKIRIHVILVLQSALQPLPGYKAYRRINLRGLRPV